MTVQERNAELAERWFRLAWGQGDVGIADEVFAEDFVLGGRVVGPDGPRRSVLARHAAFYAMTVTIEHLVAEGPLVLTHFSTRAKHSGPFHGVAPTGRWVTASGMVLWRLHDGKVVEDRNCFDLLSVLSGIGAGPPALSEVPRRR